MVQAIRPIHGRTWCKLFSQISPIESRVHLIHGCVLYMDASYTRMRLIHGCVLYTDASYTRMRLIHGCVLYTDASYTRMRLIHGCVLYTAKYGTYFVGRICMGIPKTLSENWSPRHRQM